VVLLAGRRRVDLLGQPRRRHHVPAEPAGLHVQGRPVHDALFVGCEGLHGHLNTSPTTAPATCPNFGCNNADDLLTNRPSGRRVPDEGLNWTIRQIPGRHLAQLRRRPAGRRRRR
jgi:hypothetical protein